MQSDLIFGSGLVDAYYLEPSAIYPRVIVTDPIPEIGSSLVKRFGGDPFSLVFSDNVASIDYLDILNEAEDDVLQILSRHRAAILKALDQTRAVPRYLEKHEWSSAYHNFYCSTRYPNFPNLMISNVSTRWKFETLSERLYKSGDYRPARPESTNDDDDGL